jgi:hypothetical protein
MFPAKTALSETRFTLRGKSEKRDTEYYKKGLLNSYAH